LIQVGETIGKVLQALGVLKHRHVALCQSMELRLEGHSPRGLVVEEEIRCLGLDRVQKHRSP
jgi:phosphoribosylformylglycinamidine (FGAM) synthase PurS component